MSFIDQLPADVVAKVMSMMGYYATFDRDECTLRVYQQYNNRLLLELWVPKDAESIEKELSFIKENNLTPEQLAVKLTKLFLIEQDGQLYFDAEGDAPHIWIKDNDIVFCIMPDVVPYITTYLDAQAFITAIKAIF